MIAKLLHILKTFFCPHDSGDILDFYVPEGQEFTDCGRDSVSEVARGKTKCRCKKCKKVWVTETLTLIRNKETGAVSSVSSHARAQSIKKEKEE
jgi:hypothetical protein